MVTSLHMRWNVFVSLLPTNRTSMMMTVCAPSVNKLFSHYFYASAVTKVVTDRGGRVLLSKRSSYKRRVPVYFKAVFAQTNKPRLILLSKLFSALYKTTIDNGRPSIPYMEMQLYFSYYKNT